MGTSILSQKPDHVPDYLVVDFDLQEDSRPGGRLQEGLARISQEVGPVFWTPHHGGTWVAASYDAVMEIARTPARFSSDPWKYPPHVGSPRLIPIMLDPPEHTLYRAPLTKLLGAAMLRDMRDPIRAWAKTLIADFATKGRMDAIPAFAEQFPVGIILKLIGLPFERAPEFRALMKTLITSSDQATRDACIHQVAVICTPVIELNMREPQDTLIGKLSLESLDGRPVTSEELMGYCLLLFVAGLDTVLNSIGFGIYHLAKDQDLQARLRADPTLIPKAIEEILRRYSIVNFHRTVMEDGDFFGAPLKRHDRITYSTGAADLDPAVYTNPLEIKLDRMERPHLAFFAGIHRCAGFNLARIEMTIAYEELFKAIPTFRLDPENLALPGVGATYSMSTVPIVW